VEAGRSPNIEILSNANLLKLEGQPGAFEAVVRQDPRYIDEDKCTACGTCTMYCPRPIADTYNERLNVSRAVHIDYAQAIPATYYIDPKACMRVNFETCTLCAQTCTAQAIDFSQQPKELTLNVGAVILAPGFGKLDSEVLARFGYGRFPNVVTSLEFERLTCASGPSEGHIVRLSDGTTPRKIAWLQCIGSRDETCGNGYCSSVCCMYAIKEASVAKEHEPDLDISIFFMDVRTHGKGFDESRRRAQEKYGINVIRARVPRVDQVDGRLALTWVTENGVSHSDIFDMVVLSVGLDAPEDALPIADITGIELNKYDFCRTSAGAPLATTRPGIFVAGAFQGPKDVPESVTQATGAAGFASELLAEARNTRSVSITYPEEDAALMAEEPRIGVFVCHCGVNIAGVIDVKAVRDYAATLPGVVLYENMIYSCSQDALKTLANKIKEHRLNRVVIAACSPRTHEPLFQETLRSVGVNPALIEMANIRDQCAWVHAQEPEAATEKAKDLVRMAVAKAGFLSPLPPQTVPVTPRAIVLGGGAAGMNAALSIADQGYEVVLVEKGDRLGGNLARLKWTWDGQDAQAILSDLIKKTQNHSRITIKLNSTLDSINGYVGNYVSTLQTPKGIETVEHGVMVMATGGKEYRPKGYLYGANSNVVTQLELEERLSKAHRRGDRPVAPTLKGVDSVVMIQCVGSRGDDMAHCSRLCCAQAVKNALKIKEMKPDTRVYVLYRDIRTYGFSEDLYREARRQGVIFLRYELERRPEVMECKGDRPGAPTKLAVRCFDAMLNEDIELPANLVVLSTGVAPEENEALSKLVKVPVTSDGFFLEAHAKLRPVETAAEGVYLCGLAHGPKTLDECISQAKAASAKAVIPLAKGRVAVAPIVSKVNQDACIGCGLCESLCPFNAIRLVKMDKRRKAETITASCKGCGICASHCPTLAISMGGFTDEALFAQIHAWAGLALNDEKRRRREL
jgi:heterodisulfide reductase subunit A